MVYAAGTPQRPGREEGCGGCWDRASCRSQGGPHENTVGRLAPPGVLGPWLLPFALLTPPLPRREGPRVIHGGRPGPMGTGARHSPGAARGPRLPGVRASGGHSPGSGSKCAAKRLHPTSHLLAPPSRCAGTPRGLSPGVQGPGQAARPWPVPGTLSPRTVSAASCSPGPPARSCRCLGHSSLQRRGSKVVPCSLGWGRM